MKLSMRAPLEYPAAAAGSGTEAETKAAADAAAAKATADAAAAAGGKTKEQLDAEAAAGKTPEQIAAEKAAAESAAAAATGAPAKYALKLPEGAAILPDDVKALEALARKNNLTNDEAQAALDEHNALLVAESERFKAAAVADPDYGGDKLVESQRLANSVIDRFRPKDHARREAFLAFINRAGANNHPEVLGFLADIGRAMGDDAIVAARGAGSGNKERKSHAEVMFPETKPAA